MANVFKAVTEPNNKVNHSHFDLSFQNNLTMQFGYLYPCFVKKFAPNTSVKIKPTFGLNFMPMMFPVQTRMRARMSFYKVRCRSVWKDYKDWFGNLKPGLTKPYINFNTEDKLKKMASTGSLGDYLGLPTTFPPLYGAVEDVSFLPSSLVSLLPNPSLPMPKSLYSQVNASYLSNGAIYKSSYPDSPGLLLSLPTGKSFDKFQMNFSLDLSKLYSASSSWSSALKRYLVNGPTVVDPSVLASDLFGRFYYINTVDSSSIPILGSVTPIITNVSLSDSLVLSATVSFDLDSNPIPEDAKYMAFPISLSWAVKNNQNVEVVDDFIYTSYSSSDSNTWASASFYNSTTSSFAFSDSEVFTYSAQFLNTDTSTSVISDINLTTSPYYNSFSSNKEKQLKLDASFFRAYEAIYNAYFRDIRNNPYVLNGQPEYNVFIPSDEGGEDNNTYELRRRNWEADFLTTAVQSPQQGRAPLVGITTYGDTGETALAFTAEDGKKYSVTYDYNAEKGELENLAFQELSADAVIREPRNMMDLVSSGISISDLRNVNAYTKFLELNMRKGYFYKDLVEGHFDTKVRYDELNMPEFIGGTAKDIFVNPVSQTVQTSQDGSYFGALGSYAGQASVRGEADNTISAFFDEETIVIGLISIVPVANYSQLLPKHFLHRELLDSYFPEFDNIGFQPITYNEVCPIQTYNDNPDKLLDLFGYQRPWYDYVASVDEVHGLFRTNLRNFLINRVFSTQPTLSESFLLVDPEQVNDVFSVTETTDKILGQIWFDVSVKAPISRIAIPRLD